MPTLLAFPTTKSQSFLFSPALVSDGTFAGGMGRGHWGNGGFNVDRVYAYLNGVYSSGVYIKISAEITNIDNEKIGQISAIISSKIIIGHTQNNLGLRAPIIGFLIRNQNNQFVGRIMSVYGAAPHMWGYFIPNI